MLLKCGTEDNLTHLLWQEINILLVASLWGVVELYQSQSLGRDAHKKHSNLFFPSCFKLKESNKQNEKCKTHRGRHWVCSFTWVVAVMESTKVGTVEQLRFSRRPWRGKRKAICKSRKKKKNNNILFPQISQNTVSICCRAPPPRFVVVLNNITLTRSVIIKSSSFSK